MGISSRVQKQGGPAPHNPRKTAAPSDQTSTFIPINEAKSIPDMSDQHLKIVNHPTQAYDGSGGRAHRVRSGVPR